MPALITPHSCVETYRADRFELNALEMNYYGNKEKQTISSYRQVGTFSSSYNQLGALHTVCHLIHPTALGRFLLLLLLLSYRR